MVKKPLLIVEDDPVQQMLLERMLEGHPYAVTMTADAASAMSAYENLHTEVVVCDINLPGEINGIYLLKKLLEYHNPPVVLMQTGEGDIKTVIETMRSGAYDYLIKPFSAPDFLSTLERAFDHAETERVRRVTEKERSLRLETQLASRRIIDNLMRKQSDRFAKELFGNINTSFSQGGGIGTMLTLLSMFSKSEQIRDGKFYAVDKEILDLVFENTHIIQKMLTTFSELEQIVSHGLTLSEVTLSEFHDTLHDLIDELKPLTALKNQKISLSDIPRSYSGQKLKINWEFMSKAMRELLINAMKFAPEDTTITVLIEYLFLRTVITVLNEPAHDANSDITGIPPDYRQVIFEPFFRLAKVVDDRFGTLDYGLGLTMVEKVLNNHKGKIHCTSISDYFTTENMKKEMICFELELPM